MKKTYCDVCGIECDDLGGIDDGIHISYPTSEDDTEELNLPDICWDCREEIADFIRTRMKDASRASNR